MARIGTNGLVTYLPEDKNQFTEGSDIWEALNAGYEVTVNRHGFIVDIWDPATGNILDNLGNIIGNRIASFVVGTPFNPQVATNQELDEAIEKKIKSINVEFDALNIIKKDLAKKWDELVEWNEVRDKRPGGYRRRTFTTERNQRIGIGTR